MTDNYPLASTPPQRGEPLQPASAEEQGTADVVKNQATDLSHSSIQTGKHVADVAREQASGVAVEAGRQGRDLLHQAQGQLEEQAAQGQQRLANQLLSLSDELRSMADASAQSGMAASLASQAASRARHAGQWLDDRKPSQVADEMQSFARRRPAVFLALAVGAGLVAAGSPGDLRTQIAIIPRRRLQLRRGLAGSGPNRQTWTATHRQRLRASAIRRRAFLRRPAICRQPAVIRPGKPMQRTASGAPWSLMARRVVRARCE